jgi:hypothetical protein
LAAQRGRDQGGQVVTGHDLGQALDCDDAQHRAKAITIAPA